MFIPTTILAQGGTVTSVDFTLSGDVTMTNADQFYDGPSGSFAAGTWYVSYHVEITGANNESQANTVKLWDGVTTYDEVGEDSPTAGAGAIHALAGFAVVTLGSTTTLKVSAISARAGSTIKRDLTYQSASSHTASRLSGLKIA